MTTIPPGVEAAVTETVDDWLARYLDDRGDLPKLIATEVLDEVRARCVLLPIPPVPAVRLTPRQRVLLELLPEPLTYRQIGSRTGSSENLTRQRARTLYGRLGVQDRWGAVLRAVALGLLPLDAVLAPHLKAAV